MAHCWLFQICWHIECSPWTASLFRTWNSSAGISSPLLTLFVLMLPKAELTLDSRMSGSRWVITPLLLSGSWGSFLYSSSVYSCHLFKISSASVRSIPFLSFIVPIFAWDSHLVSLIFLKRSLVFPILSFYSLHWLKKIEEKKKNWKNFFAMITEEGFLISPCYCLGLCVQTGISFLFCFAFCFSSFLSYLKASSDNHFVFMHFLLLGMVFVTIMNLCP